MSWRLIIWISFLYPQQYDLRNPQPSVILSTHVSSSKSGGTMSLEGLNLSLSERWIWWLSLIATLLPEIFLLSSRHQTLHVMLGFNIITVMNFTREEMNWKPKKNQIWKGIWVNELCNISALSYQSPSSHIITQMGQNSALCKRLQSVWKQQWKHMECQIVINQNKYYFECKGN